MSSTLAQKSGAGGGRSNPDYGPRNSIKLSGDAIHRHGAAGVYGFEWIMV